MSPKGISESFSPQFCPEQKEFWTSVDRTKSKYWLCPLQSIVTITPLGLSLLIRKMGSQSSLAHCLQGFGGMRVHRAWHGVGAQAMLSFLFSLPLSFTPSLCLGEVEEPTALSLPLGIWEQTYSALGQIRF